MQLLGLTEMHIEKYNNMIMIMILEYADVEY